MLDEHPIIRNVALVIGFVSLVAGAAGIMWNIYAEAERSSDQTTRLASIQAEQVNIRRDMALQTADIEEVRETQATIVHRFDRIEDGQRWLSNQVQEGSVALAIEVGRLLERTERRD